MRSDSTSVGFFGRFIYPVIGSVSVTVCPRRLQQNPLGVAGLIVAGKQTAYSGRSAVPSGSGDFVGNDPFTPTNLI